MSDFKLSASLAGHDDDVRAVAFPASNAVISASRDATVRLWKIVTASPPFYDATIAYHGTAFVNTVTFLKPSDEHPEGLIVSGGKETIIEVRLPGSRPEDNAAALLLGHEHNVCALDVDDAGKFIVSGSWDATARIWPVGKWECAAVLRGHEGSVWAVLAYDSDTIITGCADKLIRIFHTSGKLLKTLKGGDDVVRALCRIPKGHSSGADFASAGNDGIIRLWTLDGTQLAQLVGHENYIYSLGILPSGEFVSTGEDRTLRIWREHNCIQTITHPAISVWSAAVCAENGDIATGASDRIVRIFSRDPKRYADAETIRQFEESVKASAIPQQQLPQINKEKLPGPEFLTQKSGTKEGQVQMIKEHNGSITAYQWSGGQHEWVSVGTVVDAVGSSGKKVEYAGQSYDYVFDVDVEEGKPPLKLPYNLSQNPYEAATKFIENNELPISYLDQVANFITQNTQGATIGQQSSNQPHPTGYDPWGTESRYRPGESTGSAPSAPARTPAPPKTLPQTAYLSILVARYDSMAKKIEELNQQLISNGRKDISLNPTEVNVLKRARAHLESSGATTVVKSVPGALELAVKLVTQWPANNRLPGLDLLRLLVVDPTTASFKKSVSEDIISVLEASITDTQPPIENNVMMAIRAFANLFESSAGRDLAKANFERIQSLTNTAIASGTTNRNLAVAVTTLYINYAVLFNSSSDAPLLEAVSILGSLSQLLATQKDSEVVFRAVVAVGTLLHMGDEVVESSKEIEGFEKNLNNAVTKAADPRIKAAASEIKSLLK